MLMRQTEKSSTHSASWAIDFLFLGLFLGSLFFILLGSRPLFVPDEGRYAEIAREMVISHDYITPTLNGIIYFEKPALFYWLGAAAFKLAGINVWSIRSINALLGLLGCFMTYSAARILYNRRTGVMAALILGTNLLYFVMAHMVSLDLTVTVFLSVSLFAFLLAVQKPDEAPRRAFLYLSVSGSALAVLTKGLIGIVFPILIVGIWIALLNEWKLLKRLYLPSCLLLFLAITMPWHVLLQSRHPEFFHFYFIEQHFLRYTDKSIGHYEPIWFFIPYLLLGFMPWLFFLPRAIKMNLPSSWKLRRAFRTELFLLVWAATIFLFFSFSKSKLIPYILPLFPALSVLTARYAATVSIKIIVALVCTTSLLLVLFIAVIPKIDNRTVLPLANILKPILKSQDEVITYNQYYQDLPFYLERPVSILNWQNELRFGMQHQPAHSWMIDDLTFWQHWHHREQHVYVVMSQNEYDQLRQNHPATSIYLLGKTTNTVLISNTPP